MIAVAAMMATMSAKAQIAEHEEGESTIQPRIGITMSTLTNMDGAEMKVNLTYGVEYEYFVNDQFSLAAGVLFTDQGAKIKDEEDEYKMNIYYAAVPLMANYYVLPGLAVKAGMDVVGTDFSKGSRQHNRNIKRVAVLRIGLSGRTDGDRHGKQNQ